MQYFLLESHRIFYQTFNWVIVRNWVNVKNYHGYLDVNRYLRDILHTWQLSVPSGIEIPQGPREIVEAAAREIRTYRIISNYSFAIWPQPLQRPN